MIISKKVKIIFILFLLGIILLIVTIPITAFKYPSSCKYRINDSLLWKSYISRNFSLKNNLQTIYLDIRSKHMRLLLKDRARALATGILTDPTSIPAQIKINNELYSAQVRLKGDLKDHYTGRFWSLRVNLKKKHFSGMKIFSLQLPETRNFLVEPIFMNEARRIGLIAPRYDFVRVIFNGNDVGLIALEEHMSKEILEHNKRKESVILRYADNELWSYSVNNKRPAVNPYQNMFLVTPKLFNSKKISKNINLSMLGDFGIFLMDAYQNGSKSFDDVFDSKQMVNAMLLGDVWNTTHPVYWPNMKFYLNPFTLKLEPIVFDNGHKPTSISKSRNFFDPYSYPLNELPRDRLKEFINEGINLINDTQGNKNDFDFFYKKIASFDGCQLLDLEGLYSNKKNLLNKKLDFYFGDNSREALAQQMKTTSKKEWDVPLTNIFHKHIEAIFNKTSSILTIKNYLPFPVILEKIILRNENHHQADIPLNEKLAPNIQMFGRKFHTLKLSTYGTVDQLEIFTTFQNQKKSLKLNKTNFIQNWDTNTYKQSRYLPSFIKKNKNSFIIQSGTWNIEKPIIFPNESHLIIKEGTLLKFKKGVYLIVNGSIDLQGTSQKPIKLHPSNPNEYWNGIFVRGNSSQSYVKHVEISNILSINTPPLFLTGGITFYKSNVQIENTNIENVKCEDALNLFNSSFQISDLKINNTISDGVDFDFSIGKIFRSYFSNIKGDALDFSGSEVFVEDFVATEIRDKGISFGEKTIAQVKNIKISNSGCGIVAKDGSQVRGAGAIIHQTTYPFMAYTKKTEYDNALLEITNTQVDGGQIKVQHGNTLIINNKTFQTESINIDTMYQEQIMKK